MNWLHIKSIVILLSLSFSFGCVTKSYLVQPDKLGLKKAEEKYGKGEYFYFYSLYSMTNKDVENNYRDFHKFAKQELQKQKICEGKEVILLGKPNYYTEGGHVSMLVKCGE